MTRFINKTKANFLLFFVIISTFIAFRKDSVGKDTSTYAGRFIKASLEEGIGAERWEIGFRLFMELVGVFTSSPTVFFFIIALLINMLLYSSYKSLFKGNSVYYDVFFISLLLFSSWYIAEVTNGLRQGMSLSVLYWAIITQLRFGNYFKFILFFLLSISFHMSSILTLPFLLLFKLSLKKITYLWLLALLFYVLGFNEWIIATLSEWLDISAYKKIKYYGFKDISQSGSGRWEGLQWDFLFYTVFWAGTALVLFFLKKSKLINRELFSFVIKVYLVLSMTYFVFGFGPFTNRIAVMAWFFLPLLQVSMLLQIKFSQHTLNSIVTIFPFVAIGYFLLFRLKWLDYFQF